ncbi:MAG TPA: hypothetical protein ENH82_04260 [bacterium]|nr:hypothetical protein [bacterium]
MHKDTPAEKYYKEISSLPQNMDKHDKKMSKFDYWALIEFAENFHASEIGRLRDDPYSCWPQCDADECEGVSCNGGGCWRDTGFWSVCPKHSQEYRDGKPQPKMKESSIEREKRRGKDGILHD